MEQFFLSSGPLKRHSNQHTDKLEQILNFLKSCHVITPSNQEPYVEDLEHPGPALHLQIASWEHGSIMKTEKSEEPEVCHNISDEFQRIFDEVNLSLDGQVGRPNVLI